MVAAQPAAEVPFNVYVIVVIGLAVTVAPVLALSAVFGVQVYVEAPDAFSEVFPPEQIVGEPALATNVGVAFTVTTSVLVPLAGQPAADVPFSVYVMVVEGFAVTLAPVDALILVFGVQVYVVAPPPVKVVLLPEHIVAGPPIVKVGVVFTVTTTV